MSTPQASSGNWPFFQARYAEATEQGLDDPGSGSINDVGGGVAIKQTVTDFSRGTMKQTGGLTDLALQGDDGFFAVRKNGEQYLTRAGNFQLTSDGNLVTQQGYAVLADDGSPITIDQSNGPFEVTPDGAIWQGGSSQNMAIVQPTSLADLTKVGENLFKPGENPQPVSEEQRHVGWGYLEQSTVKPTAEMVQMIETSRAVEANINIMQAQDQMLSGLVTRVLKT